MKYLPMLTAISFVLMTTSMWSQEGTSPGITLTELYTAAETNYPLVKGAPLIDAIETINFSIITKGALPRISLNGTGQIQSESIELNLGEQQLEGPLETYNVYLAAEYDLYDGGKKSSQRTVQEATSAVERQQLAVEIRSVKDRVNTMLFAIELARKQNEILLTSIADLDANIEAAQAGFENGATLESEVLKLKVKQLELKSQVIELEGNFKALLAMLQKLTGTILPNDVEFEIPQLLPEFSDSIIDRPEQKLYNLQKDLLDSKMTSVTIDTRPILSLFAQSGVGNPNPLNFSDFEDSPYALGGLKLKWNFLDWGKSKKEKQLLEIQKQQIAVDEETFLFNIDQEKKDYQAKISAIKDQIKNDLIVLELQKEILKQSEVQLENGVSTASEFVTQVNATISAEQEVQFNQIQLQQY